ncbi:hypothetical protein HUK68_22910 (plasmid) [Comamonas antarctica]|uniref:Uncharacterized protein n=2 Tax=Comamonas antarctica TaxID=2743470 RepID=A0A6N1XCW6_9BURK|nr:hypothetical protein HUK68_22910 [Comamonas antarctica]
MPRSRSIHRLLTFMVLSLLFYQLALANYVCPQQSAAAAMAEMMAAGEPCAGMDTEQPVLCHHYSVNAPQSAEWTKVPTPSLPAIIQMLVVPAVVDASSASAWTMATALETRPPPDPVFLSTLRLRV